MLCRSPLNVEFEYVKEALPTIAAMTAAGSISEENAYADCLWALG